MREAWHPAVLSGFSRASSLLQSPPPSAIHGRRRLTRHPCRVAHCAEPPLGLTKGRTPQQRPRRPTGRPGCWVRSSVRYMSTGRPPSRASSLPQELSTAARFLPTSSPPSLASQLPQGLGTSANIRSAVRPPSRASRIAAPPLPQKNKGRSAYTHASHHSTGRALARLPLLILIHPPPRQAEWRRSSGEWRAAPFDAVELIACRSKRSRPEGNAPG
ncbi:hypothetical protein QF012_005807 [Pseudomonas laurylsulfatiphila]